LRFVEMKRLGVRLERVVRPRDGYALLADRLDLLGPRIDERDVVAGARQERSDVAADGSGSDEQDLLGHAVLLAGLECRALSRVTTPRATRELSHRRRAAKIPRSSPRQ